MSAMITPEALAAKIDMTLLSPKVGFAEAGEWMDANRDAGFATLCVSPFLVPVASQKLAGSATLVGSVAGFPLGYSMTECKAEEAAHLVALGAAEIDVVANIAALLEGEDTFVLDDLRAVVAAVRDRSAGRAIVKVILETGHLSEEQLVRGCGIAVEAGAAFVKTSTGFGPRGASVRDVEIMRASVPESMGVKAAGGIRDLDQGLELLDAGANRLGTSAGADLLAAARSRQP